MKEIRLDIIIDESTDLHEIFKKALDDKLYYLALNFKFDFTKKLPDIKKILANKSEDIANLSIYYKIPSEFLICFIPTKASYDFLAKIGKNELLISYLLNGVSFDSSDMNEVYFNDNTLRSLAQSQHGRTKISWLYNNDNMKISNSYVSRYVKIGEALDVESNQQQIHKFFKQDGFKKDFLLRLNG